jgi:predicted DNA-binding WGR domain protein
MYGKIQAEDDHKAMNAFLAAAPSTKMMLMDRIVIRYGRVGLVEYSLKMRKPHRRNDALRANFSRAAQAVRRRLKEEAARNGNAS